MAREQVCDGCGQRFELDSYDRFPKHNKPGHYSWEGPDAECSASGLADLNPPPGPEPHTMSGGLPTLGKHHR